MGGPFGLFINLEAVFVLFPSTKILGQNSRRGGGGGGGVEGNLPPLLCIISYVMEA